MPFKLGKKSKKLLDGVHPRLCAVVETAITLTPIDFTIIDGLRTPDKQQALYDTGKSKTLHSKHLKQPDGYGHAVDIIPCSSDPWNDVVGFDLIRKVMFESAKQLGVPLRWGGDWDGDGKSRNQGDKDEKFIDLPHYELKC
jgi:peptidoglycan LD-endopeptidase CwlK